MKNWTLSVLCAVLLWTCLAAMAGIVWLANLLIGPANVFVVCTVGGLFIATVLHIRQWVFDD